MPILTEHPILMLLLLGAVMVACIAVDRTARHPGPSAVELDRGAEQAAAVATDPRRLTGPYAARRRARP